VWFLSVRPCPCGHVIDALKRFIEEEWQGAQCMGGWSGVTVSYRAITTRRMYRRGGASKFSVCIERASTHVAPCSPRGCFGEQSKICSGYKSEILI